MGSRSDLIAESKHPYREIGAWVGMLRLRRSSAVRATPSSLSMTNWALRFATVYFALMSTEARVFSHSIRKAQPFPDFS